MNRQTLIGIILGAVGVTAIGAFAGYQLADDAEYAEVVAVEPNYIVQNIPREECRDQVATRQKPVKDEHQVAGSVAGAVIGGILGNQVGDGSGKDIATAAGAVAGGYAGNKVQEKIQENATEQTTQRVCDTVYEERRQRDGFLVTYEWEGSTHEVVMAEDPGRRIPVENGELRF